MKNLKASHFLVIALLCLAGSWPMFAFVPAAGACLILVGIGFMYQAKLVAERQANRKAIDSAHRAVDDVFNGKRYLGEESKAIYTIRLDQLQEPGPLCCRQLCRTRKGAWFLIEFETRSGSGVARYVRVAGVLDDGQARNWLLAEDREAYKEHFGDLPEYELA